MRATTATTGGANGYIEIEIKETSGGNYVEVGQNDDHHYDKGEVIVEACYNSIHGIRVRGPSNSGWIGSIEISTDDGNTWAPLYMKKPSGSNASTSGTTNPMCVDGDNTCGSTIRCRNGETCNLYVSSHSFLSLDNKTI